MESKFIKTQLKEIKRYGRTRKLYNRIIESIKECLFIRK